MIVAYALYAALFSIPCPTGNTTGQVLSIEQVATNFGYGVVNRLDVQAAIGEGQAAKEAAKRVLLLPDVSFAIVEEGCTDVLSDWISDERVIHNWTFPNGSRRRAPRPPIYVLRHEIGHDLFVRRLVPRTKSDQYSSDAPDWLDEMAAIAFEGGEQQLDRRREARMDADEAGLLPLQRLLTMAHPEFGRAIAVPPGQTFSIGPPASKDTIRYYATIFAFHEFLVERTSNAAIVAELATAFRNGEELDRWILALTGHVDGASIEALEEDFLAWFAANPLYVQDAASKNE